MPKAASDAGDDTSSVTFTTASTALTPSETSGSTESLNILQADPMAASASIRPSSFHISEIVPWPGKTYIILQRGTNLAITLTPSGVLRMQDAIEFHGPNNRWMCVEQNGYFGFYNEKTMTYIGHDNRGQVAASARKLQGWELVTPRRHPDGGYQLLSPHWADALWSINVVEQAGTLTRTPHGGTLWEFEVV